MQRHTFGNLGQSMTRVRATTDTQQKRTFGCNKSSSFSTRLLVLLYTCSGCHANAILNVLKQPPKRTARLATTTYTTPTHHREQKQCQRLTSSCAFRKKRRSCICPSSSAICCSHSRLACIVSSFNRLTPCFWFLCSKTRARFSERTRQAAS